MEHEFSYRNATYFGIQEIPLPRIARGVQQFSSSNIEGIHAAQHLIEMRTNFPLLRVMSEIQPQEKSKEKSSPSK